MGGRSGSGAGGGAVGRYAILVIAVAIAAFAFAFVVLWGPASRERPVDPTAALQVSSERIEQNGLAIGYQLESREGRAPQAWGSATATFTIHDAATGAPVRGLAPRAWMWPREGDAPPDEDACRKRIRTYLGGRLSAQAEVDLNAYLLLALNDDNSISVINPQIALSRTKLLKMLTFQGRPADWALQPDRGALWVTLPENDGLAIVDTRQLRIVSTLAVGDRPMRVVVAPDGRTVWVGNEGDGTVTIVDTAVRRPLKTIPTGGGAQRIVFADRGRLALVASSGTGTITLVDTGTLEVRGTVEIGAGIDGLAAGEEAGAVLATRGDPGEVVLVDVARGRAAERIRLQPGVATAGFDRSGRWAFVLNPVEGSVTILDPSGAIRPRTIGGFSTPDALSFTERFAYVRNARNARLSLIPLDRLEEGGEPGVVEVSVGDKAPAEAGVAGIAQPVVPLPEGNGAFLASPADGTLVYYQEGMMAPSGSHRNYGRKPLAVLVLDQSLREAAPGAYASTVELRGGGKWDVGFLVDRPRVVHCFEQTIDAGESRLEADPIELTQIDPPAEPFLAGAPALVRFRLDASDGPIAAAEVEAVVLQPPHTWHRQLEVRSGAEAGTFEVAFEPPRPGRYKLNVAVPARNASLGSLRPITIHALDPATKGERRQEKGTETP